MSTGTDRRSGRAATAAMALAAALALFFASCAGSPAVAEPATGSPSPVTESDAPVGSSADASDAGALPVSADQVRLDALDARFSSGEVGPFARKNAGDFFTFTLSNGIPVVLKKNDANNVRSLSLVLRGGSLIQGEAGIEAIMLRTLARASADWPYPRLRAKLDETSSSFSSAVAFGYSLYTLTTLDRYFDELLPIWAGTLTAPGLDAADFDRVLSDAKLALQKKEQDPWQVAGLTMNQTFFRGHPYAATPEGTKESLASLDLAAVRDWYEATFSANRAFVVAVGNYDPAELELSLEAALGSIPDKQVGLPTEIPSFEGRIEGGLVKKSFEASKGVAYLRGDFAAPAPTDPDFPAMSLAMRLLSDLLFNLVRDKYGAVYSPGSYIRAFEANYGSITLFKTGVPEKAKAYVDEALAELAAGRVVSVAPGPDEGKYPRQTIAEALDVYKALFVNETYEKIGTNAAVAGEIARSVLEFGDPRAWLLDVDRIGAVSPAEVSRVLSKWLFDAKVTWVALGPAEMLDKVEAADFGGNLSR